MMSDNDHNKSIEAARRYAAAPDDEDFLAGEDFDSLGAEAEDDETPVEQHGNEETGPETHNEPSSNKPQAKQNTAFFAVIMLFLVAAIGLFGYVVWSFIQRQSIQAEDPLAQLDVAVTEKDPWGNAVQPEESHGAAEAAPLRATIAPEAQALLEQSSNEEPVTERAPLAVNATETISAGDAKEAAMQPQPVGDLSAAVSETVIERLSPKLQELVAQAILEHNVSASKADLQAYARLVDGKSRAKGFNVVEAIVDGKAAVVLSPKNNYIVLVKGENLTVDGARTTVEMVELGGRLILLANGQYIDAVREAPKASANAAPAVARSKNRDAAAMAAVPKQEVAAEPEQKPQLPIPEPAQLNSVVAKPVRQIAIKADGWKVVAFTANGVLVLDPNGRYVRVNYGESINGLGKVSKANEEGRIYVGDSYYIDAIDSQPN